MLNDDRAEKKAASLWLKTKTEFTGNWHIDLDDQAIIVNAFAAELSKAYAEIEVGLQISGSFFEALKPLNLQTINVANPGQHVSDLIAEIARLRAQLAVAEQQAKNAEHLCDKLTETAMKQEIEIDSSKQDALNWVLKQINGQCQNQSNLTDAIRTELAKVKP